MPRRRPLDRHALDSLLQRRQGVVRTAELARLGVPPTTTAYRVRAGGPWQRALPGVIVTFNGVLGHAQQCRAALVYAGGGAILTGVPALRRYGLRDLPAEALVHLLVPHRRHRSSFGFALIERTRRLPPHRWIEGLPCAPPERAVLDACRRLPRVDQVRAIIAEAVQRGLCDLRELVRECAEAQIRGTRLPRLVLREVLDGSRSVAEAKARGLLRRSGLPMPLWNHDIYGAEGRWLARPDAYWPGLGVVLEIDSMAWHLSPASYRRTQARQRRLTKHGLLVIPVAPSELSRDPVRVLGEIEQTLEFARTRPAPEILVHATSDADRPVA